MIFVYLYAGEYIISQKVYRMLRLEYPGLELITSFHKIQHALAFVGNAPMKNLTGKTFTGLTPESREAMREAKRGARNPNAAGLSETHKRRISQSMKAKRRRDAILYHRTFRGMSCRNAISQAMKKLPKRRWALDLEGHEHFWFAERELPPGWTWGRARHQAGHHRGAF